MKSIPIVLLVSERSGSNLLRTLLGKHANISAPIAPHLLAEFFPIRKYYGDLRVRNNSNDLVGDMVKVVNHPYHDWGLNLEIHQGNYPISVLECFDFVYSLKSKQDGKVHYCSKGLHSFSYIDQLKSEFDNVQFIHLIRDPRDHVVSWMKRPMKIFTPFDAIIKWKNEQRMIIDAIQAKGFNCLTVKFEDLITNTEDTMTKILDYLELKIDKDCFTTDSENKESKRNPYWKNLSKPIMKNKKGNYESSLSKEDVLLIESVAKDEMDFFEYERITSSNWVPGPNYSKKLKKLRKIKKESILNGREEDMTQLREKWDFLKNLKTSRINNFKVRNGSEEFNLNNHGFKKQFKGLLTSILGEKNIKKLISSFYK